MAKDLQVQVLLNNGHPISVLAEGTKLAEGIYIIVVEDAADEYILVPVHNILRITEKRIAVDG